MTQVVGLDHYPPYDSASHCCICSRYPICRKYVIHFCIYLFIHSFIHSPIHSPIHSFVLFLAYFLDFLTYRLLVFYFLTWYLHAAHYGEIQVGMVQLREIMFFDSNADCRLIKTQIAKVMFISDTIVASQSIHSMCPLSLPPPSSPASS